MRHVFLVFLIALVTLSSCFFGGKEPLGSIRGYKDGVVRLNAGFYRVGPLATDWCPIKLPQKILAFRHATEQATIATNAFCGTSYDDASLEILTRHLYGGINDLVVTHQQDAILDGRRALFSDWYGTLDGVPVWLQTVSLKKNDCLFDFYLIALPGAVQQVQLDFRHFVEGFQFQ